MQGFPRCIQDETKFTRVSFDIRTIPVGVTEGVKRRGSYFKPKWLKPRECPLDDSVKVTSVATLDTSTPVYLQRKVIEKFAPQKVNRELVEFHNINHNPTLLDAMLKGPVIAYTVRQFKSLPEKLSFPIGFADENVWFLPEEKPLLDCFWYECNNC